MILVATIIAWMFIVVYLTVFAGVMIQIHAQRTDYFDAFYSLGVVRTALFLISIGWVIFA